MNKIFILALIPAVLAMAEDPRLKRAKKPDVPAQKKQTAAQRRGQTQAAPTPAATNTQLKLPTEAKPAGEYAWSYTDPQGKNWTYRKTPFGLVRFEDKSAEGAQKSATAEDPTQRPVVVTDQGDSYKFARKGPFGLNSWVKKKTELTEEEKEMVKHGAANPVAGNQ